MTAGIFGGFDSRRLHSVRARGTALQTGGLIRARVAESRGRSRGMGYRPSGYVFDDFNEFVDVIAVVAGEGDEFPRSLDDRA